MIVSDLKQPNQTQNKLDVYLTPEERQRKQQKQQQQSMLQKYVSPTQSQTAQPKLQLSGGMSGGAPYNVGGGMSSGNSDLLQYYAQKPLQTPKPQAQAPAPQPMGSGLTTQQMLNKYVEPPAPVQPTGQDLLQRYASPAPAQTTASTSGADLLQMYATPAASQPTGLDSGINPDLLKYAPTAAPAAEPTTVAPDRVNTGGANNNAELQQASDSKAAWEKYMLDTYGENYANPNYDLNGLGYGASLDYDDDLRHLRTLEQNYKNFESMYNTAEKNASVDRQNAFIQNELLKKYLPTSLKAQGLGGLGVSQSAYLEADNNYSNLLSDINSNRDKSVQEMLQYYLTGESEAKQKLDADKKNERDTAFGNNFVDAMADANSYAVRDNWKTKEEIINSYQGKLSEDGMAKLKSALDTADFDKAEAKLTESQAKTYDTAYNQISALMERKDWLKESETIIEKLKTDGSTSDDYIQELQKLIDSQKIERAFDVTSISETKKATSNYDGNLSGLSNADLMNVEFNNNGSIYKAIALEGLPGGMFGAIDLSSYSHNDWKTLESRLDGGGKTDNSRVKKLLESLDKGEYIPDGTIFDFNAGGGENEYVYIGGKLYSAYKVN